MLSRLLFAVVALLSCVVIEAATTQVNVKSFGARGDGITDDTVAIKKALATGLPTFFPSGIYNVSSTLQVVSSAQIATEDKATLIEADAGATIQYVGATPVQTVLLCGTNTDTYAYTIRNLRVLGSANAERCIEMRRANHIKLENVVAGECTGAAIYLATNVVATLDNIRVSGNEIDPWTIQPAVGIHAYYCNQITIISPTIEKMSDTGIWLEHNTLGTKIIGGTSEANIGTPLHAGIRITDGSHYGMIDGIDCEGNIATFDLAIEDSYHTKVIGGFYTSGVYLTNAFATLMTGVGFRDLHISADSTWCDFINCLQDFTGVNTGITDLSPSAQFIGLKSAFTGAGLTNVLQSTRSFQFIAQGVNNGNPALIVSRTNNTTGVRNWSMSTDGTNEMLTFMSLGDDYVPATRLMRLTANGTMYLGEPLSTQYALQILESTNASGPHTFWRHYVDPATYVTNKFERALRLNKSNVELMGTNYTVTHTFGNDGSFTPTGSIESSSTTSTLGGLDAVLPILTSGADLTEGEALRFQLPGYDGVLNWRNSIWSSVSSGAGQGSITFKLADSQTTQTDVLSLFNDGSAELTGDLTVGGTVMITGAGNSEVYGDLLVSEDVSADTVTGTNNIIAPFLTEGSLVGVATGYGLTNATAATVTNVLGAGATGADLLTSPTVAEANAKLDSESWLLTQFTTGAHLLLFREDYSSTTLAHWIGICTGGDTNLYQMFEIRSNATTTANYLQNAELRRSCKMVDQDSGLVFVGAGWGTNDSANTYGGTYAKTTASGDSVTWTTPAGMTAVGIRIYKASNAGFGKVTIDGDTSLATKLLTAADYVSSGELSSAALVENGGTLNPTDRLINNYRATANNDYDVELADNLPSAAHVVVYSSTGYSPSTGIRIYITAGFCRSGASYALSNADSYPCVVNETDRVSHNKASAWEFAYSLKPTNALAFEWAGSIHGNETLTSFTIKTNGAATTLTNNQVVVPTSSIYVVRTSNLTHTEIDAGATAIASAVVTYSVTPFIGLVVQHSVTHSLPCVANSDYFGMMPVNTNFYYGSTLGCSTNSVLTGSDGSHDAASRSSGAFLWQPGGDIGVAAIFPEACIQSRGWIHTGTEPLWLEDRVGGVLKKIYMNRTVRDQYYEAGSVVAWSSRYFVQYFSGGADTALTR